MIRWDTDPEFLTDEQLLVEYQTSEAEAEDPRLTALAAEIEQRNLDL